MSCADEKECCGQCHAEPEAPAAAAGPTPEQYEAIITDLVGRLQTADAVITGLVLKAGGQVILSTEDAAAVAGKCVVSEVPEDKSSFTFRVVSVEQPATVQ